MCLLDYIDINTTDHSTSCVIWLHGLGANGHDFASLPSALNLGIRFILPHAPVIPVSINSGHLMPAWFDILSLDDKMQQDEQGIRKAQQSVEELIEEISKQGIPTERIILGGFSQGGALALHTGLRYSKKLAGVVGLSTYLPLADFVNTECSHISMPIFLAHGTHDAVVPYRFGKLSHDFLCQLNYPVSWHEYAMGHSICPEELQDLSLWLQRHLGLPL